MITPALPNIILTATAIAQALRAQNTSDEPAPTQSADSRDPPEFESTDTARPSGLPVVHRTGTSDEEDSDAETYWAQRAGEGDEFEDNDIEGFSDASAVDDAEDYRHELGLIDRDESNLRNPTAGTLPSESGPQSRVPGYQFCPAAHRLPLLRLFSKHACQHTLLPERHGESRSSEDIYRDAVAEMYRHCKTNRLAEVWAYLWNSWYSRPRWKLWARSAYQAGIPRKRTTMMYMKWERGWEARCKTCERAGKRRRTPLT